MKLEARIARLEKLLESLGAVVKDPEETPAQRFESAARLEALEKEVSALKERNEAKDEYHVETDARIATVEKSLLAAGDEIDLLTTRVQALESDTGFESEETATGTQQP